MRDDRGLRRRSLTAALAFAIPLVVGVGACGSSTTADAPVTTARPRATTGAAVAAATTAGAATSGVAASSAATATAARNAPTTIVPTAAILQFKAPLLAGGALDGTTFTGKPVALWFWAPW